MKAVASLLLLALAATAVSANEVHYIYCSCFGYGYDSGTGCTTATSGQAVPGGPYTVAPGQTVTFVIGGTMLATHPVEFMTTTSTGSTSTYPGVSSTAPVTAPQNVSVVIPATGYTTPMYILCQVHDFYITVNVGSAAPTSTINWAVASPGFYYTVNGGSSNPTIQVPLGARIIAAVNTDSSHPMCVQTSSADISTSYNYVGWHAPQTCSNSATMTIDMPSASSAIGTNIYFICQIHKSAVMITATMCDPTKCSPAAITAAVNWATTMLVAALSSVVLSKRAL